VVCEHCYWPLDALNRGGFAADVPEGWYDEFSHVPDGLHELASRAGAALGGDWSVDIIETTASWYVTDCAEAARSFHFEGCEKAGLFA
jgi:hypothetical protein